MKKYLVGGAVRDNLLGVTPKERDWVVVGAHPETLINQGYKSVGKDFPVFLHPKTKEEYALARTERKIGKGYTGFSCYAAPDVTLEDDLLRRDLTINAIAQDENGNFIDPYNGKKDLENRILRHVSPAFVEDPLRVLRLARFAAQLEPFNFKVADETLILIKEIVASGELSHLVAERVWQETQRALASSAPQVYFEVLRSCGALALLFPEIDNLFGIPQNPKDHPEIDTGIHALMVLEQASLLSESPLLRFGALCHDFGKAITPKALLPSHKGHEARGVKVVEQLGQRYRIPRDYLEFAVLVTRYHGDCHSCMDRDFNADMQLTLLENLDAFRRPERFELFLIACEADSRGRTGYETASYEQRPFLFALYQATNQVNAKKFVEQGLQGQAIKKAIRDERLAIIESYNS